MAERTIADSFTEWAQSAEPSLRRALVAAFGPQVGREAAVDALSYAWEHWERVGKMDNPIGYIYVTGRDRARRITRRRRPALMPLPEAGLPRVEPGLPDAMAGLSERQRTVVTLLHGFDWTMSEVAEVLGISKTSVQNHATRGLAALQRKLGVLS